MPPQPLSSVKRDAKIILGPLDFIQRKDAAIWIANCISNWAEVELYLGTLMTTFLGEAAAPTVAIYLGLTALRTRISALSAAAPKC